MAKTGDPAAAADRFLKLVQFKHLVQGFESTTGLAVRAYSLAAVPQTIPFEPSAFCKALQSGLNCPLYFDPQYHHASAPEIRQTCAGVGHAVVPVLDAHGRQFLNLVSDPARLGPIDMDGLTELSFKLKVFPDDLIAQSDQVPLVPRDRLDFATRILFDGLRELATGESARADALAVLTHHVAEAAPEDITDAILAATLDYTDADFGYITMLNDTGARIADGTTLSPGDATPIAVLRGLADWVIHAGERVEVADIAESAWCRYLAGKTPPPAGLVGLPLMNRGQAKGGIVIGGMDVSRMREWSTALGTLVEAGSDAFMLARRLVETGGGELVDRPSGAYNVRFLEDLLEKEISRAGRHNNDLSLVFFHADNYNEMLHRLGADATERALNQMVEVMRSRTRKVNSLARISQTDFCLVVPEADSEIAEKIAQDLQAAAQEQAFTVDVDGGSAQVQIALHTRTMSNPRDPDEALLESLGVALN